MSATILIAEHYDAVRALISPDVTSVHISDAFLGQITITPDAERNIRKRLAAEGIVLSSNGTQNTKTGTAIPEGVQTDILLAMIHECMSNLSLVIPQMMRQEQLVVTTEVQKIDWEAKQAFHIGKVDEKLVDIVDALTPESPSIHGRSLPMGAVGTLRSDVPEPTPPYRRAYIDR